MECRDYTLSLGTQLSLACPAPGRARALQSPKEHRMGFSRWDVTVNVAEGDSQLQTLGRDSSSAVHVLRTDPRQRSISTSLGELDPLDFMGALGELTTSLPGLASTSTVQLVIFAFLIKGIKENAQCTSSPGNHHTRSKNTFSFPACCKNVWSSANSRFKQRIEVIVTELPFSALPRLFTCCRWKGFRTTRRLTPRAMGLVRFKLVIVYTNNILGLSHIHQPFECDIYVEGNRCEAGPPRIKACCTCNSPNKPIPGSIEAECIKASTSSMPHLCQGGMRLSVQYA
ncbi:hypothetical protein BD289DRAFT_215780 [Coniella lustricola]|uniref:Uncharacterized protein n=1 Tax=Coniella lustricola TaxID=2025994 RepID=A0A2T2ZS12_9PEZI|nr:hypothetical protein BD289DRAFT_215780 [Coniella lustricola]